MKQLKKNFRSGMPKQDVFDEYTAQGGSSKKAAMFLSLYPDHADAAKYRKANNVFVSIYAFLIFLVSIGALLNIINIPEIDQVPIWFILFGYLMEYGIAIIGILLSFRMMAFGYYFLAIAMIAELPDMLLYLDSDPIFTLFTVSIAILLAFYSIRLKLKLFPFQNFLHMRKTSQGIRAFSTHLTMKPK